jgi:hypothetical protein
MEPVLHQNRTDVNIVFGMLGSIDDHRSVSTSGVLS